MNLYINIFILRMLELAIKEERIINILHCPTTQFIKKEGSYRE